MTITSHTCGMARSIPVTPQQLLTNGSSRRNSGRCRLQTSGAAPEQKCQARKSGANPMSYYYPIQKELRETGVAIFGGAKLRIIPDKAYGADLEPGDTYVAERNSGPHLLTVKTVVLTSPGGTHGWWITPVEKAYSFDFGECVGVDVGDDYLWNGGK